MLPLSKKNKNDLFLFFKQWALNAWGVQPKVPKWTIRHGKGKQKNYNVTAILGRTNAKPFCTPKDILHHVEWRTDQTTLRFRTRVLLRKV
jgi:hypothetical protein